MGLDGSERYTHFLVIVTTSLDPGLNPTRGHGSNKLDARRTNANNRYHKHPRLATMATTLAYQAVNAYLTTNQSRCTPTADSPDTRSF